MLIHYLVIVIFLKKSPLRIRRGSRGIRRKENEKTSFYEFNVGRKVQSFRHESVRKKI
jgi:hypothetical protein